jgi:methylated-DNA-[protein]-cysteine S-methyltransferase
MFDAAMMARIDAGSVFARIESPVGALTLFASQAGLHAVLWDHEVQSCRPNTAGFAEDPHHPILKEAGRQLGEYFAGSRTRFELALAPRGTEFQQLIWRLLREIPYGQTLSYGDLAARSGDRNRSRAVGLANSRNPISIIIPCHRVIGRSGALTGFGGGLPSKAFLLDLEQRVQGAQMRSHSARQCVLPALG